MTSSRWVFRFCLGYFQIVSRDQLSPFKLSPSPGSPFGYNGSFPESEYCADFLSVVKRECESNPIWSGLLTHHTIEGLPYTLTCQRIDGLTRSNFFAELYQMEETCGEALLREGLYPVAEYIGC